MSSISLPLDTLRLRDQTSQLKLSVDTTLDFDNLSATSSISNEDSWLDLIMSRQCWVARGSFCEIDLSVQFNRVSVPEVWPSNFLVHLGQYLCSAPLWTQLGLSVTLDDDDLMKNATKGSVRMRLTHDRLVKDSDASSHMKLCSVADVMPPEKTLVIGLDRLSIVMNFQVPPLRLSRIGGLSDVLFEVLRDSEQEIMLLDGMASDRSYPGLFELDCPSELGPKNNLKEHSYGESLSILQETYENGTLQELLLHGAGGNTLWPEPELPELSEPMHSSQSPTSYSCQNLSSTLSPGNRMDTSENLTEMPILYQQSACKMAEVALRMLIGGKQKRRTAGMNYIKPSPTYSLSELVPAMFNPGFLRAMAERSSLIPPLKQAFSKSLLLHAQSTSLCRNIMKLGSYGPQLVHNSARSHKPQAPTQLEKSTSEAIEIRLWQIAQHQLYSKDKAHRLKHPMRKRCVSQRQSGIDVDSEDDDDNNADLLDLDHVQDEDEDGRYESADEYAFEDLLRSDGEDIEDDLLDLSEIEADDKDIGFEDIFTIAKQDSDLSSTLRCGTKGLDDQRSVSVESCDLLAEATELDDMLLGEQTS